MSETWLEKYNEARKCCQECLNNGGKLVNGHTLIYWAKKVDTLRKELMKLKL